MFGVYQYMKLPVFQESALPLYDSPLQKISTVFAHVDTWTFAQLAKNEQRSMQKNHSIHTFRVIKHCFPLQKQNIHSYHEPFVSCYTTI
ncbi:hypothetical protein CON73_22755 [Bacillus toyonensis]|uniref:Uncharacterized protein n=1 Tax=Bacillus toyonensis TaxID=155322 RepID=A0A2B5W9J4_9BACI|nr:hypothetical protein CN688_29425 [Bacillus toyonensis]PEL26488.1 hypothetical protein CN624_13000 [Bacillus toyonensis]PEO57068.1 hypothetical protein CN579_20220 [Bacillus toyonensis]PEP86262.1 hypothetical protein CN583_30275 [Bacillus toyonensis]PGA80764.1 hypothetical protein COL90_11030 [Bacillus toyonensis]